MRLLFFIKTNKPRIIRNLKKPLTIYNQRKYVSSTINLTNRYTRYTKSQNKLFQVSPLSYISSYKFCTPQPEPTKPTKQYQTETKISEDRYYIDKSNPKYEAYTFPKRKWDDNELDVEITHVPPVLKSDKAAFYTVKFFRHSWDFFSGYTFGPKLGWFKWGERMWLRRIIFLESIAGVPGFVFGMVRHLKSLRRLERDRGWINTLMSEAENERIHLLTAMNLYKPGRFFRLMVVVAQGVMCNFLFLAYLINPNYCHRFVGYIEEEAVTTYTGLLKDIDKGLLPKFNEPASDLAKNYWHLDDDATWRDVFNHILADEAHHRDVNHTLAPLSKDPGAVNPFRHEQEQGH